MTPPPPAGRLGLDLIFALFLVNGLMICAAIALALIAWAEDSEATRLAVFALAASALGPSLIVWIASGVRALMQPRVRGIRIGALLATVHLVLWGTLMVLGASRVVDDPSGWVLAVPVIGTCVYGLAVTWLSLRWFFQQRRKWGPAATEGPA